MVLRGHHQGAGYELYYPLKDDAKHQEKVGSLISQIDFHMNDLKAFNTLEVPVHVFAYESNLQKKLAFGGGSTDVTDVVTPSIHIKIESWPHSSLRHELVHALLSADAFYGLGFHPNIAFTEGIAVALAPSMTNLSLDQSVRSLLEQKKLGNMEHIFSPLFWLESSRRAYRAAGSFINYLIRQHGVQPIISLYNGENWEKLFPKSQQETIKEWQEYLNSLPQVENDKFSEAVFRYPGLLRDQCPHSKASLRINQKKNFDFRQPSDWQQKDYLNWRLELAPESKAILFQSKIQKIKGLMKEKEPDVDWLSLADDIPFTESIEHIEDFQFNILRFDLLVISGQRDDATLQELLLNLQSLSEKFFLGHGLERSLEARRLVLQSIAKEDRLSIFKYLAGFGKLSKAPENSPWIHHYLYLRRHSKFSQAAIQSFLARDLPETSEQMKYEWFRSLGRIAMRNKFTNEAVQAFEQASNFTHSGSVEITELFLKEAKFSRDNSLAQ